MSCSVGSSCMCAPALHPALHLLRAAQSCMPRLRPEPHPQPVNSSRGRGVRMVVKPAELPRDIKDVLVQHYINNPYTINGALCLSDCTVFVNAPLSACVELSAIVPWLHWCPC